MNRDLLMSRTRWAYALPERVVVRVSRDDEYDFSGTRYEDDGWRQKQVVGDRLSWRVDAQWSLSRLVYDPDQLAVAKRADDLRRRTDDAVDLATRLYFERRRLQLAWLAARGTADGTDPAALRRWTTIAELTARLNVMTGGLFRVRGVRWWSRAP